MAVVLAFMMLEDERVGVYGCHGDVKHVSAEFAQQCLVSSVHRDTRARAQTGLLWQHIALLWGDMSVLEISVGICGLNMRAPHDCLRRPEMYERFELLRNELLSVCYVGLAEPLKKEGI